MGASFSSRDYIIQEKLDIHIEIKVYGNLFKNLILILNGK